MCRSATATRRRQHGAAAAGQARSMVPGHGGGRRHRNADLLRAWRDQRPASGRAWLGGRGAYHRQPNRRRSALPIKWRTAGLPNRPAGRDNLAELALPVAPLVSSQRKPRKAARTRRPAKWTVGEPPLRHSVIEDPLANDRTVLARAARQTNRSHFISPFIP